MGVMKYRSVLFLIVVLLGCPAYSIALAEQEGNNSGRLVPVTPLVVRSGPRWSFASGGGICDELRQVIRDRETWDIVWKRIYSPDPIYCPYSARVPNASLPPLPEIDFSGEMLVVAAMGQRPSSGYGIIVNSARERDNRLEIEVHSVSVCGAAFGIMTAPVDIARLPKTDLPVTFREVEVKRGCK